MADTAGVRQVVEPGPQQDTRQPQYPVKRRSQRVPADMRFRADQRKLCEREQRGFPVADLVGQHPEGGGDAVGSEPGQGDKRRHGYGEPHERTRRGHEQRHLSAGIAGEPFTRGLCWERPARRQHPTEISVSTIAARLDSSGVWPHVKLARADHWFNNLFVVLGVVLAWFCGPTWLIWATPHTAKRYAEYREIGDLPCPRQPGATGR